MLKTRLSWAKAYEKIEEDATKELEKTPWWKVKKVDYLRSKLRWAKFHRKKCEESVKNYKK